MGSAYKAFRQQPRVLIKSLLWLKFNEFIESRSHVNFMREKEESIVLVRFTLNFDVYLNATTLLNRHNMAMFTSSGLMKYWTFHL